MKRVRDNGSITNESVGSNKNLSVRDMLKITRTMNESEEIENKATDKDRDVQLESIQNYFSDMQVNLVMFEKMIITEKEVVWGGVVDGMIKFTYSVTAKDSSSNVVFKYLDDFSQDNPENNEIIERLEAYYREFYKYWRENAINMKSNDEM